MHTEIVYIRSERTAFDKDGRPALKCHPNGYIQCNRFGEALTWERWTLHIDESDPTVVALQSWTGKFLTAQSDFGVNANVDTIGEWEKWKLVPCGKNKMSVAFQSCHGKYLVCDDFWSCGKDVRANRERIEEWERFVILNDPRALTAPDHTQKLAVGGAMTGLGALVTIGALAIPLVGFTVGGVAAGSAAAGLQSAVYGGATTGVFSVLQSAGATLAWVPFATGGATMASCGSAVVKGANNQGKKW